MKWSWRIRFDDTTGARSVRESINKIVSQGTTASDSEREGVTLVVGELISNAFRHGGGDEIEVTFDLDGARARLSVSNDGPPFDPATTLPALERESGRGLFLVQEIAGSPEVTASEGRCVVAVTFPFEVAPGAYPERVDEPLDAAPAAEPNPIEEALGRPPQPSGAGA